MGHLARIILCMCLSLPLYSQYCWTPVIDNNNLYVTGASGVKALCSDSADNSLLLGGRWVEMTDATTGQSVMQWSLYSLHNNYYNIFDCEPSSNDTATILSFSVAEDTVYNHTMFAVGGIFTEQACSSLPVPGSYHNLFLYVDLTPAMSNMSDTYMNYSDTVLATAVVADYDNSCTVNPEYFFRTYVAASCVFCGSSVPAPIDSTRYIAFYDPAKNCNYNPTFNFMAGGTNGPVYAIQAVDTSNVYAAGLFDSAGTIASNNIAKWNGVSWDSLGSGINGKVNALQWYNGNLYAGGNFTMAGGVPVSNIAMWNGTGWSGLGSGTNGTVNALTIHNGNLYVGGNFTQAGSFSVNYVAKWDGSTWSDLLGGRNGEVYSLASFHHDLYVGGNFSGGTNDTVKYLAVYEDTSFHLNAAEVLREPEIIVSPNPASGIFHIRSARRILSVEVYSSFGEIIMAQQVSAENTEINLFGQPPGIYLLRVRCEEGIFVQRIVVSSE